MSRSIICIGEKIMTEEEKLEVINEEQLRWVGFFHYVSGGVTIAFSSMFIIHLLFMGFMVSNPDMMGGEQDPEKTVESLQMMRVFLSIFGVLIIFGLTYGVLQIFAGYYVRNKRKRLFILIVAIPGLLFIPYGTILSVFTLILLERSSVKLLFKDDSVNY